MTDKQIILDAVDESGCCQYMPRYMEDYDIDTLDYCRQHFKPCKDVDVKYCYYKQLKRKEQECEELKKANDGILTTIRILAKNNIKLREILAEIKEIASYLFNMPISQCMAKLELILSKISEV